MLGRMVTCRLGWGAGVLVHLAVSVGAEEERPVCIQLGTWPLCSTSACSSWVTQQPKEGSGSIAACWGSSAAQLELSFIWATGTQARKIFQASSNQKKGRTIIISDKIDFKCKKLSREKEGHNILIKGSVWQEDMTIISSYALNER